MSMLQTTNRFLVFCLLLVGSWSCHTDDAMEMDYFCYNETTGVSSLDPAFAKNQSIMWVVHQLYNTLLEVDSSLRLSPSLANRWEISDDGLS